MCLRLQSFRFALMAALLGCCGLARAQVDEDTLKAAFVYNFALYTTWPMPVRDATALTVCVPRTSTLAPALRALSGKSVQTRVLTVREIDVEATGSGCDVRVATVSTAAPMKREAGVLTVCDCDDTIETSGAVVMLVREGSRLRFDVDLGAASASGLSLSSKLLKLARTTR
jgi:hypothetical protein